jgi:excinuclease UvrABC nuclease subunit
MRDRIRAVKNLEEKQKVVSINVPEEDVFALVNSNKKACFDVIRFKNGRLTDSEHWLIDSVEDLAEAVASEEAAGSKEKGFGIIPKPFLLSLPFLFP